MTEHQTNTRGEQLWTMIDLRDAIDRFETMLQASDVTRTTASHYVQHSERFLNWLEGRYAPRVKRRIAPYGYEVKRSKYDPLQTHLRDRDENAVRMTFRQIEEILGFRLPPSARQHLHWWANDQTGNHTQATAWMRAGRRARQIQLLNQTVMFIKTERDFYAGSESG